MKAKKQPSLARVELPETRRGRRSAHQEAVYQAELSHFANQILELASRFEFTVSSRGWCYILEEHGLRKGDFHKAEGLINDCRKDGKLPLNICKEDDGRAIRGHDGDDQGDERSPAEVAAEHVEGAQSRIENAYSDEREELRQYTPIPWTRGLQYAPLCLVEKIDLVSLFETTCELYRVPIANAKGWSDLHGRAAMMNYFAAAEHEGRVPVLLYCGDHDPVGIKISNNIRKNFADLAGAVGWSPDNLIVDRFGLNADFITRHQLSWIDNLETGRGADLGNSTHRLNDAAYVQEYISKYGARKVEANALVTRPEAARELIEAAIAKYIPNNWPARHERRNDKERAKALSEYDQLVEELE
jgi:hypothetical protein